MSKTLPYRPGVGVMLLDARKHIFVGRRIDATSEAWQMPQGGIDAGEEPVQAVMRELKEETGTDKATILAESKGWLDYDLPDELVPKIWGGRFRGQRQKWFVLRFDGADSDINLDTHEPEFKEWKWVQAQTVPQLIVPFKQALYQSLLVEFKSYLAL